MVLVFSLISNNAIYISRLAKKKPRTEDGRLRGCEIQIMIRLRAGSSRVEELMDMLGMGQTNVSKAISFLRNKKGFVESKRDQSNARFVHHYLTDLGREYLDNLR